MSEEQKRVQLFENLQPTLTSLQFECKTGLSKMYVYCLMATLCSSKASIILFPHMVLTHFL